MAKMIVNDGVFELTHRVSEVGTFTDLIATQNTFVDKNISIKITVPGAGNSTLTITDNTDTDVTIGSLSGGKYSLTAPISGTMTYSSAGWITTTGSSGQDDTVVVGKIAQSTLSQGSAATSGYVSTIAITPDPTNTQYINITPGYNAGRYVTISPMSSGTAAAATVTLTYTPAIPTITDVNAAVSGKTRIALSGIGTTTAAVGNDYTYYASVTATTPAASIVNGNSAFSKKVGTAGYLGPASTTTNTNQITTTATLNKKDQTYYIPITSGVATMSVTGTATQPTMAVYTVDGTNAGTNIGNISGMLSTPVATEPNTSGSYYVAFTATAPSTSITPSVSIGTEGWIGSSSQITGSGSISASNKTWYSTIQAATLTSVSSLATATPSGLTLGTVTTTQPSSGKYIKVEGQGTVKVNQAGYAPVDLQQSSTKKTVYYPIQTAHFTTTNNQIIADQAGWVDANTVTGTVSTGTISVGTTAQSGWTTNTTAVVPAEGYLYIGAGYYPNTQISLSTLIPDDTDYPNITATNQILSGFEAYDTNGKKYIGTLATYDGEYTSSGWSA